MKIKSFFKISFIFIFFILLVSFVACKTPSPKINMTYSASFGGEILGEVNQIVESGASGTEVTAQAYEGYEFVEWSDGITTAARMDQNIQADITVTAKFEKLTYAVNYSSDENGAIQGKANQTVAYGSNSTTVTAIPNDGYEFVKWSDGVATATRSDKNIRTDIQVTALFEKLYIVSYTTDGNGKIVGEANQTVAYGSNSATVTAKPKMGYKFVGWTDGITTAERTDEDIQSNINVTAMFEKLTYTVSYSTDGNGEISGETNQTLEHGDDATSITAIPNEGYKFVKWSDGIMTATRTDRYIYKDIAVVALFDKKLVDVHYAVSNVFFGSICFLTSGTEVRYGEDGPRVKAVPEEDVFGKSYVFIGWSDGVLTAERQDLNITSEINVVANFAYSAKYKVNGNIGGRIEGDVVQTILPNEISKEVVAIPDDGYVFAGWSDLSLEPKRQDTIYYDRNIEVLAYFEPIEKTFKYDYGIASGKPTVTQITLNRNDIQSAEFVVPTYSGYSFCGWYADKEYRTKVVNENGRYMHGYAAFSLETDTLYAKWQKEGEEIDTHKILLVFVDEVQTELYSSKLSQNVEVHSKMSALDYEMSKWVAETVYDILSEWLAEKTLIEIDSYYTTEIIDESILKHSWTLYSYEVSETANLISSYHNTLTTLGLDDYSDDIRDSGTAGVGGVKNACVFRERYWVSKIINHEPMAEYLNQLKSGEKDLTDTVITTYIHEFIHTAELNFKQDYNLHDAIYHENMSMDCYMTDMKLYLLNEYVMNGVNCGVPVEYWKHDHEVKLRYAVKTIDGRRQGKLAVVGETTDVEKEVIAREVKYGSDFSIEAIPNSGYRFVKWSDGVTTAIRHDENIISHINVEAIFEKI